MTKEEKREYDRKYREEHRDTLKEYNRAYREKNRDRINEYHRKWAKNNRDRMILSRLKYYQKEAEALAK